MPGLGSRIPDPDTGCDFSKQRDGKITPVSFYSALPNGRWLRPGNGNGS
jgi:hypothetical protein